MVPPPRCNNNLSAYSAITTVSTCWIITQFTINLKSDRTLLGLRRLPKCLNLLEQTPKFSWTLQLIHQPSQLQSIFILWLPQIILLMAKARLYCSKISSPKKKLFLDFFDSFQKKEKLPQPKHILSQPFFNKRHLSRLLEFVLCLDLFRSLSLTENRMQRRR